LHKATGSDSSWLVGYSPDLVLVLHTANVETGPATWREAFDGIHAGLSVSAWTVPAGLGSVIVCVPSGQLPTEYCPATRRELFLLGQAPNHLDSLYQSLAVNWQSGRLATVLTAPEFLRHQIFLNVPAELQTWAAEAGLPVPPSGYDVLAQPETDANASIQSPAMFSMASGKIAIEGTANPDGLRAYRVLVGQGLYPSQWREIGRGSGPVEAGLLATWDSSGEPNGLYAIQLQMLVEDERIENVYSFVTLEN
jgi:hypothetical protein